MFRKKAFWIGLAVVLALAAGGGYAYYTFVYRPGQEQAEPTISTTEVRQGDLVISVSGSGTLVPVEEVELGFQGGSYLDEVLVNAGDQVQAGDVLARLETDDLALDVAEADIEARLAQLDLDDAQEGPSDDELADARADLQNVQTTLTIAQYTYDSTLNSDLDSAVRARDIEYKWYLERYWEAEKRFNEGIGSQSGYEKALNNLRAAEARLNEAIGDANVEELNAKNQVDQAQNTVYQAQENLKLLQGGPTTDTVMRAELALDRALLTEEDAHDNLEAAELRAPFGGTVVDVTALPGEYVGTTAFVTLADLEKPLLQFWVEESDMSGVAVGNRVEIIFEALPDDTFTGEVIRIDPALVTVGNTLAVQAWASVDLSSHPVKLLGGMNAEVEVISAESRGTLLVPLQALRELGPDQYAVFVVQPDGELVLRPVEVGLQDLVNVEIISGLELSEVVSLGEEQESTETTVPEQQMGPPGEGPMGPPGGGPMGPP